MPQDLDDPRLTAYALGELDDDESEHAAVEVWLAEDEEARHVVEEIRATARLLTDQLGHEPSPGLAAEQRATIERCLAGVSTLRPARRPWWLTGRMSLAATLLAAVGTLTVWGVNSGWEIRRKAPSFRAASRSEIPTPAAAPPVTFDAALSTADQANRRSGSAAAPSVSSRLGSSSSDRTPSPAAEGAPAASYGDSSRPEALVVRDEKERLGREAKQKESRELDVRERADFEAAAPSGAKSLTATAPSGGASARSLGLPAARPEMSDSDNSRQLSKTETELYAYDPGAAKTPLSSASAKQAPAAIAQLPAMDTPPPPAAVARMMRSRMRSDGEKRDKVKAYAPSTEALSDQINVPGDKPSLSSDRSKLMAGRQAEKGQDLKKTTSLGEMARAGEPAGDRASKLDAGSSYGGMSGGGGMGGMGGGMPGPHGAMTAGKPGAEGLGFNPPAPGPPAASAPAPAGLATTPVPAGLARAPSNKSALAFRRHLDVRSAQAQAPSAPAEKDAMVAAAPTEAELPPEMVNQQVAPASAAPVPVLANTQPTDGPAKFSDNNSMFMAMNGAQQNAAPSQWMAGNALNQAQANKGGQNQVAATDAMNSTQGQGLATGNSNNQIAAVDASNAGFMPRGDSQGAAQPLQLREAELAKQNESNLPVQQPAGPNREAFEVVVENPFVRAMETPLSTFGIDVDTASYAIVRRYLMSQNQMPPKDAVRVEEMVNAFRYDYPQPKDGEPFSVNLEIARCPWNPEHRLARIGLQGRSIDNAHRPPGNIVFLIDVSGSMGEPDKLPLLKTGMRMLTEQLVEGDRVAIVTYADTAKVALETTPGERKDAIVSALDQLHAGGSTNGAGGLQLAYDIAGRQFQPEGTNRVVLATDGDFNVGVTAKGDLEHLITEKARGKIHLTVLGFGRGNLQDDRLEALADKGDGQYHYIDTEAEARKVLVEQVAGSLVTIAKDVKLQVDFNPSKVGAYRLIGYEKRAMAAPDFNNDAKDSGDLGAGHSVTAFYELAPPGSAAYALAADAPRFVKPAEAAHPEAPESFVVKLHYKTPDGDANRALEVPAVDEGHDYSQASPDFKFAAAVASFALVLRDSNAKGTATLDAILELAEASKGPDSNGDRAGFLALVRKVKTLVPR